MPQNGLTRVSDTAGEHLARPRSLPSETSRRWLWYGFGMALVWLWYGFGMALVWLWCGFGVALVEPWWSLGGALVEPWGGFGVALGWLCTPESMPSIWPWGGLGVALRWLWVALPGVSAFCTLHSAFAQGRRWNHERPEKTKIADILHNRGTQRASPDYGSIPLDNRLRHQLAA